MSFRYLRRIGLRYPRNRLGSPDYGSFSTSHLEEVGRDVKNKVDNILVDFKTNLLAGLSVALVSLPLAISLSIACGGTPQMGILSAVWGGTVSSIAGGSEHNIGGPAAALASVLTNAVRDHGHDVGVLHILAFETSVIVALFCFFRMNNYLAFVPSCVILGFMLGVALITFCNQLNSALGIVVPQSDDTISNLRYIISSLPHADPPTFVLYALTVALMLTSQRFLGPKFPAAILAAAVGIALSLVSAHGLIPLSFVTLRVKYGEVTTSLFTTSTFKWSYMLQRDFHQTAFTVALIAALEAMIAAKVAENVTKIDAHQRRELFGVALCNFVCGVFASLPSTASLARTALNIQSGATSRVSGVIGAVGLGIASVCVGWLFDYLPMATVAAILTHVAIRMCDFDEAVRLYRYDKKMFSVMLLVACTTVVFDPLMGILVGVVVTQMTFLATLSTGLSEVSISTLPEAGSKAEVAVIVSKQETSKHPSRVHHNLVAYGSEACLAGGTVGQFVVIYHFAGEISYFNASAHVKKLKRLSNSKYANPPQSDRSCGPPSSCSEAAVAGGSSGALASLSDSTKSLGNKLGGLGSGRSQAIILSLQNVLYVDVDGINMLEEICHYFDDHHIQVLFCGVREHVLAQLEKREFFQRKQAAHEVFEKSVEALMMLGATAGFNAGPQESWSDYLSKL